jgi:hypothetical protein
MTIELPGKGQPLDVTFISQMASAIRTLQENSSTGTYKYVTVDTPTSGKQSVKASEARYIGRYIEVVNSGTVKSGDEKSFSIDFTGEFKYAPIATVTPVNVGGTLAGKNVSVILKNVTTSGVEGIVRFNEAGDLSVAVNVIILGIPN